MALAAKMSVHEKKWIDTIDIDKLQIELAEKRIMIGFFNNFDIHSDSPLIPAVQYFSAKSFFSNYNFKSDDLIDEPTAVMWIENCRSIIDKAYYSIRTVPEMDISTSTISEKDFNKIMKLKGFNVSIKASSKELSKGQVILFLYDFIKSRL